MTPLPAKSTQRRQFLKLLGITSAGIAAFPAIVRADPLMLTDPVLLHDEGGGSSPCADSFVTSWYAAVQANAVSSGDTASISSSDLEAHCRFYHGLQSDGLVSSIIAMVTFPNTGALDTHLNGCLTAFIKTAGNSHWPCGGLGVPQFSVNGLTGTGAGNSSLQTGVLGTNYPSDSSAGIIVYCSAIVNGASSDDAGYLNDSGSDSVILLASRANSGGAMFDATLGNIGSPASPGAGYYSLQRVASNDLRLWYAKSTSAHAQLGSTFTGGGGSRGAHEIFFMAGNHWNTGGGFGNTQSTYSLCAITAGLGGADDAKLYARGHQLRIDLGGGFV